MSCRNPLKRTPLKLPLTGDANRPIYDSAGKLVSIVEWAEQFAAAMNLVWLISERALDAEDSDARAVKIIADIQQLGEGPDTNRTEPLSRQSGLERGAGADGGPGPDSPNGSEGI